MSEFLEVDNLSKHFGGLRAVDQVSFAVEQGSLAAIIGPNGAGKTTLFNLVAGTLSPTSGHVRFEGTVPRAPCAAARMGVARTFQNVRLFHEMTLLENVLVGMMQPRFLPGSLRLPPLVDHERRQMRRALHVLEDVGLQDHWPERAGDLPFGRQRLLEIARATAINPKLLLLDEPAAGLNRTETAGLAKLIRRLVSKGITILLVEHDMHLVMNLVERVIVLDSGRLIADGTPAEVSRDRAVVAASLGSLI